MNNYDIKAHKKYQVKADGYKEDGSFIHFYIDYGQTMEYIASFNKMQVEAIVLVPRRIID